jgi:dolichyl-phosphate beta-glucosyltransferase
VDLPAEVIVVDDGSSDGTQAAVDGAAVRDVRVLRNSSNRGKGYSVRRGMLAAKSDWVLFMDADNSTSIEHLARVAPHVNAARVIIASRRLSDSRVVRPQHRLRQMLGRTFPHIVRALALPGLMDTQCGFKVFRRDAAQAIFARQTTERFAFDVEVLLLARLLRIGIAEVPVDWDNPTISTVRIRYDTIQMLWDVLRSTWRRAFGVKSRKSTRSCWNKPQSTPARLPLCAGE